MRRLAVLAVTFLGAFGVLASPAFATFHLEMVNEVMLASSSGDGSVQFVELLDHGGTEEVFPPVFAPFKLGVYDGAGNKLGEQMLNPDGLRAAAASDSPYLISTSGADAAFGVTGDEKLTVTLPAAAGQACFEGNPQPHPVSCITWGTVSKPVATNSTGSGVVHGPVPANGQSDQRQPDGTVIAAAPTPKAANATGGGGGGGRKRPPFSGVKLTASKAHVNRKSHLRVGLRCPKGGGRCSGRLTLSARGKPHTRFGRASFKIPVGRSRRVPMTLTKAGRNAFAASHGRLKTRVVVVARNAAGHQKTTFATLTLTH